MHSRPSRPARDGGLFRLLVTATSFALALAPASAALAQGTPPGTGTDMELDPDAPKPSEKQEPGAAAAEKGEWGVGGKDEEGTFAPGKKKPKVEEVVEDKGPKQLGPPAAVSVDTLVGLGSMRDVTNDDDVTKLTMVSFVFGLSYRFGESLTLGARFPYSTGSIKGPRGAADDYNTFAVGNAELGGRYAIDLSPRLTLPIEAAFYAPTASGDLFADASNQGAVAQALLNQAAAYSRGFEENPLFASKRLGVRVGGGLNYDGKAIHFEGHTRFDLMAKTGGNTPNASRATLHTPNTSWLLGGSFFYDFLDGKVSPGLRSWLTVTTMPISAGTRNYSGPQLVLEPDVYSRLPLNEAGSLALRFGLGYVLPVGGALGGGQKIGAQNSGSTGGLRVHAEFQF